MGRQTHLLLGTKAPKRLNLELKLKKKTLKKTLWPLFVDGVQLPQG